MCDVVAGPMFYLAGILTEDSSMWVWSDSFSSCPVELGLALACEACMASAAVK